MYSFRNTILLVLLKICGIARSYSNSYPDSVKEGNKETERKTAVLWKRCKDVHEVSGAERLTWTNLNE